MVSVEDLWSSPASGHKTLIILLLKIGGVYQNPKEEK
jgi:hypothetical protein